MSDLAIIIVSWNVQELLQACLKTIETDLQDSNLSAQIWVVDNASTDQSVAMIKETFPQVKLIESEQNLGFAGGNNAALRAIGFEDQPNSSQGSQLPQAVLLLNPDTEIHQGALQTLFNFLTSDSTAGIVGAKLIYGDGSFQHSGFGFPGLWQLAIDLLPVPGRLIESSLNGRYPLALYQQGQPFPIGHPLGAAMMVRREAIQQAGLLDEAYHMYVEEVDWSKRITALGWNAYCVPEAVVTHFGGQSTGQIKTSSFLNLWRSRSQFYRKHYGPLKVWLATQLVKIGMQRLKKADTEAVKQGQLTPEEQSERAACYQKIADIWQGGQASHV
ncbi:MAG: glycosyltransferase family 2 protein [Chloroflexota bacterium]